MPPRVSRGGARGGRGRGGRGRAGSAAATSRASLDNMETTTHDSSEASDLEMLDAPAPAPAQENLGERSATSDIQIDQSIATGSARPSRTPSVAPSRSGGRLRPKNVRRDAAERAMLEAERNRDLAVKIKEEERELRAEERRARRGRGRGDMSQRGFTRRTVMASGPFSSIPQENVKSGSGGGGGGSSGAKRDAGITSQQSARYKPRREHEDRINIDLLNGLTELDEDGQPIPISDSLYNQKSGSLPVGLLRTEYEEAEVKVKTTAELEAEERQSSDDEDLFISGGLEGIDIPEDSEVWHAAPKSQVKVKSEPGTEQEAMDVDMADIPEATQIKAPDSPEAKKKTIIAQERAIVAQRRRKAKAVKDPEVMQSMEDLQFQLNTLSFTAPVEREKDGDADAPLKQFKDDRLMLFQLPPILPPLALATNGDTEAADLTSPDNSNGAPGAKVKTEDGIKKEEGWNPFAGLPQNGGLIGKLNVRKSGKVELDWGGTILSLGVGAETEFLTSAIMVEQNVDLQNPEKSTGTACGMGEIVSKFVLAPIWDEEEDWDPTLDDIEGLDQL
ncbi:RNA polymerase III RPC4-domain-containing protein [Jackrogersella minutella]|nr:RNA polymerase III RPC4-domain-containing protein [Jackrogersella minutella]